MKTPCVLTAMFLTVNLVCFGNPATEALNQYLREQKASVSEGHISVENCGKEEFFTDLIQKNDWIHSIGEIGFNAGHSSVTFLAAKEDCTVVSFDIMVHAYARVGKNFVDAMYPKRHSLVEGDSLKTVPAFYQTHPTMRFDLIFIDGGHDFTCAYGDLLNMRRLAKPQALVVMDDMNYASVAAAWDQCIKEGIITETQRISKDFRVWTVARYNKR
jgi:predicted O-methyltransferase YrrM